MGRRGRSARKAKAARQRASTATRSNAVRATRSPTTGDWPQPIVLGPQRNPCDACARLQESATERDRAQAAVDLEVSRLRQIGLGWVPIAAALKMSR
jgi:hypothetical protein